MVDFSEPMGTYPSVFKTSQVQHYDYAKRINVTREDGRTVGTVYSEFYESHEEARSNKSESKPPKQSSATKTSSK